MPEFGMPEYLNAALKAYNEMDLGKLGKELAPDLSVVLGLKVPPEESIGLDKDVYAAVKLEGGVITEIKYVPPEEGEKATLLLTVPYTLSKSLVKDVLAGKQPNLMGMVMGGKVKIKGDMTKLMKYAGALPKLTPAIMSFWGKVETIWPDELPPDKLEDFKARLKKVRAEQGV